jgi:hypothetical protein
MQIGASILPNQSTVLKHSSQAKGICHIIVLTGIETLKQVN